MGRVVTFNFDLNPDLKNHHQGFSELENGIKRVYVTYTSTSMFRMVSLGNAVAAYHIKLKNAVIQDIPNREELHFSQLEVLEFEYGTITNKLLLHIILHAPQLNTLVLKNIECFINENILGMEVAIALYNSPNFKSLQCWSHSFTPEAQLFLKSQEKFYWVDTLEAIQDISVLQPMISARPKLDRASRFIQDIPVLQPMTSTKPQAGIVYADCSDNIDQSVTDGQISLKTLPVCDKKPYFSSYPEGEAKNKLRQGLFYLDQEDYSFKNVKSKQTYQKLEIELKKYLNYQQGSYLKTDYVCEQYNPGLTLKCMAGVRVPLYTTSPQDELVALAVRSLQGNAVSVTVERGDIDGLYYLTTTENSDIVCEFVMATPPEELQPVPQPLRELAKTIQAFGIGSEDLPEGLSNKERLNALWERKEGACKHRTEVFLDKAAAFSDEVVVYMVMGSNHAWPELHCFGMRTNQNFDCLGGYPTVDRYAESNSFKKEKTIRQIASEKKIKKAQEKAVPISDLSARLQPGRNYLVIVNHSDDAHVLMDSLLTEAPHRTHTVHHGKRLHTIGKGIVQTEQSWAQSSTVPGAFGHFLDNLQERDVPVIILDLPPGDLVKYNSLFNRNCRNRYINSKHIPDNAIIIILATPYSVILEDNSILSRQHEVIRISAQQPRIESVAVSPEQAIITHSLYGSDDWQALLLGYCGYNKEGQPNIFKGHLLEAILQGYAIKIIHPPKNNADFDAFIRDVNAKKGFWFLNEWYNCPQGVEVDKSHAYDFLSLDQVVMSVMNIPPQRQEKHYYLINSHTFERCLRNTVIVGELPCQDLGWIEMAAGETLQLYVTDNLSVGQWYCLLETCVKYEVRLQVESAPGVSLPHGLREYYPGLIHSQISNTEVCMELGQILFGSAAGGTMVYSENHLDSYYQCQELLNENGYKPFSDDSKPEKPYLLIDASELSDESALYRNKISNDNGVITAFCDISNIVEVLERENGIVVLTGDLRPALLAHLSTLFLEEPYLWINGEKHKINGRLMVIPEKGQPLSKWIAPDRKFIHPVLPKPAVVPQLIPVLPTKGSDAQWWSKEEFKAVLEARKEFVLTALETKPFVFLQGSAGSGKSSLVLQLQAEPDMAVYHEEDIAAWAKDTSHGIAKILFIDEANLRTQQQWTLFQGLFNDPPGIYYNQKFYPLTKDHKIIFAGNPLNHGGKRIEPTLFKRYRECTIDCLLLPAAYIEHAVLRDIFKYIPELSENIDLLAIECRAFLQDYDTETDDIRSLQSRAMLHCYEQIPDLNKAEKEKEQVAGNYALLRSRQTCQQAIIDSLKIQQFKHWARLQPDHRGLLNAACYGGHSGVLIEGAPDTGKTALIEATLFEQGYSKVTLDSASKEHNTKVYYVRKVLCWFGMKSIAI
jgi:hypothetical protein